jgi:hypothetical protein
MGTAFRFMLFFGFVAFIIVKFGHRIHFIR